LQNRSAGRKMIYVKMPAMIFILASGYLFAVYLLLALAKRNSNKMSPTSTYEATQKHSKQEASLQPSVTDVVNTQELIADG
jgi:cytoskeletal protein RodZ